MVMCLGRHRYGQCSYGPSRHHHHLATHSYPICAVNWISFSLLSAVRNFLSEALFLSLSPSLSLLLSHSDSLSLFFSLPVPSNYRVDTQQKRLMVIKIRKQGDFRRLLGQAGTQTALMPTASPWWEAVGPQEASLIHGGHMYLTDTFSQHH